MKSLISLKQTLIVQYLLCALLPLIILSLFLITSFRSIQVDEQSDKQQALTDSVMLSTHVSLEKASQSLLQISRDTNVALAGQAGLFGYSAANALNEFNAGFDFISLSILVDSQNRVVEASPEAALLLETRQLDKLGLLSNERESVFPQTSFIEDPAITEMIFRLSKSGDSKAQKFPGVIVLNAPLYVSERETLDSRSTYTGRVLAFILIDDLMTMIRQHTASLTLEQLRLNSAIYVSSELPENIEALTSFGVIQVPFGEVKIQAKFYVLESNALAAVDKLTVEYSIYAAIIVLVFIIIGLFFIHAEVQPLKTLNKIVNRYRGGDLTKHEYQFRFTEFQGVSNLLSEMADNIGEYQHSLEDKVTVRTEALEKALLEVRKINRELITTQNQLVESEKMSQIGVLVAGVAHEVNTPIGVCVTATSILEDKIQLLTNAFENNQLSRSVLTEFIENAQNCIEILSKNTERAADLIHSFKSVSVDQSSDQKRQINIKDYVELTIRSLQKDLDRKSVSINIDGDLGYTIETYPGAISQILSNLILNSLKHGFKQEQSEPRQIDIEFELTPDSELDITFKDNGQGVEAESLIRLFEPFYTTGRQSGGSGLGLSIVYNLATQKLGGKINCYCEPDTGLCVFVEFPVTIIESEKP